MKKILLILILFSLVACVHLSKSPDLLSFKNEWGVAFYIYPRPGGDCNYKAFFIPLKKISDTSLINDSSSIFDFSYGPGISFYSANPTFLDQIKSASPKSYIYRKGINNSIVYWAFMKIIYHKRAGHSKLFLNNLIKDTLILNKRLIPIQFYQLDRYSIDIDYSHRKKIYLNPWNDLKYRSKMKKFNMPC